MMIQDSGLLSGPPCIHGTSLNVKQNLQYYIYLEYVKVRSANQSPFIGMTTTLLEIDATSHHVLICTGSK